MLDPSYQKYGHICQFCKHCIVDEKRLAFCDRSGEGLDLLWKHRESYKTWFKNHADTVFLEFNKIVASWEKEHGVDWQL